MIRACVLTALFLPSAFVVVQGRDPSPAEGCSGGPSQGIFSLTIGGPETLSVGRDGFLPIFLGTRSVEGGVALASVTVEVRDAANVLVPGTTTLLRAQADGDLVVGWSSNVELAPDAALAAFVSAPGFGGSSTLTSTRSLVVRDAIPTLSGPTLEFTKWAVYTRDSGNQLTCPQGFGGCGSLVFGETVSTIHEGRLEGNSLAPPVAVAWEVSVAADGASMFASPPDAPIVSETTPNRLEWPVFFPALAGEHCVRVTTRDLRNGASVVSDAICSSPPTTAPASADLIRICPTAPPGYEDRWCRARGGMGTPCAIGGAAGVGGVGGAPPTVGGAGMGAVIVAGAGFGGSVAGAAGSSGSTPSEPGTGGEAGDSADSGGNGGAGRAMTGGTDSDDAGAPNDESERPGRVVKTEGCGCSTPRSRSNALGVVALAVAAALRARRRSGFVASQCR
jgi:hypothetical protein